MRNIKLTIEYDGTRYNGWQVQNAKSKNQNAKLRTVQGEIEAALRKLLREKVKITGSGRTDAGVHAFAQVANFKTSSSLPLKKISKGLNALLPKDIVIKKAAIARDGFSARFDAKRKLYRYTIFNSDTPPAINRFYSHCVREPLDLSLMKREAAYLKGRHNFSSFMLAGSRNGNPVRRISCLCIKRRNKYIEMDIEADGFLYGMARSIAGTLIEIGRGRFKAGSIRRILRCRNRALAGPTAPAKGLALMRVDYQ